MKKLFVPALVLVSLFIAQTASAQVTDTIPPSGSEIIQEGIKQYDDGNYDDAISTFGRVSPCDPAYPHACYEMALALSNKGETLAALIKCEESLELDSANLQTGVMKGSLLDDLNRQTEAITWLKRYAERYPYNPNVLFNLAICYLNAGELQTAEETLIRGLHYNPYHSGSHLALARANYLMGRKAQAYLAYNMALIMNPTIRAIRAYEEAINNEIGADAKDYHYLTGKPGEYSKWDEMTGLLNAEFAFNKDFPFDFKLNFKYGRSSWLLFQQLTFDVQDPSFYNQFYVRFFADMLQQREFETFLYYTLKNTNNEEAAEWTKKNEATLNSFIKRAQANIESWKKTGFSTDNEMKHQTVYHFDENGKLQSYGVLETGQDQSKEGEWQYFAPDGSLTQIATHRNNKFEGPSTVYWADGKLKQSLTFKNNELEGENKTFHQNGKLSGIYRRTNGTPDGDEETFNTAGLPVSQWPYQNGRFEGTARIYDRAGGYSRQSTYKNNKLEGSYSETWLNGKPKTEAFYTDSLLNGTFKTWYANGNPELEETFTNGVQTGTWTSYFADGSKKATGTLDAQGNPVGIYSEWDINGNLINQLTGYRDGKPDSIQVFYFTDGKVQTEFKMRAGTTVGMKSFDQNGKLLFEAENSEGTLAYKLFFANGRLKTEGQFVAGNREGCWKYYNIQGGQSSEENWKGGKRSGIQKIYYQNGKLKQVYTCEDDRITGKIDSYFESGKTEFTGYYDENGSTGEWVYYYSNDSVQNRSYAANGRTVGRKFSYAPDGRLVTEERYNDDGGIMRTKYFDPTGKMYQDVILPDDSARLVLLFPDGKMRGEQRSIAGLFNGEQTYYYPNGQIRVAENFVFGALDGDLHLLDPNGKPDYTARYTLGHPDGLSEKFEYEKLTYRSPWILGNNTGKFISFHTNGRVFRVLNELDGDNQGTTDHFTPDSVWLFSFTYVDDVISAVSYRDKSGNMHTNEPIDLKTPAMTCYFADGKIAARLPFKNGIFDGKYLINYADGKPWREIDFKNDYHQGKINYYYPNGNPQEVITTMDGEYNGRYTAFWENGKIRIEGNYLSGQHIGKWLEYDQTGKLLRTLFYFNDEVYDLQ